jgi:hypothetical protein
MDPGTESGTDRDEARQAAMLARAALIVAAMAFALAILGLFLPIR